MVNSFCFKIYLKIKEVHNEKPVLTTQRLPLLITGNNFAFSPSATSGLVTTPGMQ